MDFDADNPLRIKTGVIPLGDEGAIVRCRVTITVMDLVTFPLTLDVWDRIDGEACLTYQFLMPEICTGKYMIEKIEMLRSVHVGTKLIETPFMATEDEYEVDGGAPSMIVFQEEKLQVDDE
jgi:hypothetical protein